MGASRGIDWYTEPGAEEPLPDKLNRLVSRALEEASRYGRVVGRVSRFFPVEVGGESRVVVEVDPETYYAVRLQPIHRIGDYLVIVDLKGRLILARVAKIRRGDLLSLIGSNMPADAGLSIPDPSSLATTTLLELEPLMESDYNLTETPAPASTSIEPQSPVVDPNPEVIAALLNLPGEGAILGALATPSDLVKEGSIPVRLPFKVFLQHVLIIGTTGSGKTTFLKNLATSIYSEANDDSPIMVFVDMNQDFIQVAFEPIPIDVDDEKAKHVREKVFSKAAPTSGAIILLPLTEYIIAESRGEGGEDLCDFALAAARRHFDEVVEPILGALGYQDADPSFKPIPRTSGECRVEVEVFDKRLIYIPYSINTTRIPTGSIARLMPDMTLLSLDLFRRTRERFRRLHGTYPPLLSIAAALHSYIVLASLLKGNLDKATNEDFEAEITDYLYERLKAVIDNRELAVKMIKGPIEGLGKSLVDMAAAYVELLLEARPSPRTLEAVYRRIGSALDSGILDLLYPKVSDVLIRLSMPVEPGWDWIIGLSQEYGVPIVLDLGVLESWGAGGVEAARILAYRILEQLKDWKHRLWASRSRSPLARRKIIVVVDEAHQFFPQQKGSSEEQEMARQIASMISQIARLGRARGIGLVFATHSPRDLHDIILQLANTKIILRTEKNQLESIDLPSDIKKYIPRLPDRFMVVSSYVYRDYLVVATTTPLTMHYDLSA